MTVSQPEATRRKCLLISLIGRMILAGLIVSSHPARAESEGEEFFESSVRPVLVEHCVRCHGADKQSGELRLDTHAGLLQGGESGPVIVAGNPDSSRLILAVRHEDLEMPPDGKLSAAHIDALAHWVRHGAVWPESEKLLPSPSQPAAKDHWAFQPLQTVAVPTSRAANWGRSPIDAFVLARLESEGLTPSPEADRRTLIRRLTYTLTGLPPSPAEVASFEQDNSAQAYELLVNRLLASEHYGEQWARHWLDVARYSDTKGYVYGREERFWLHAWVYRDWVVEAFNRDLPYDRFLLLQLAADQVEDRELGDLAAMGFLTLGRRFLGVERDIIDDRIDVVCRGTMGLTVGCARCHDHKYDPIPTADYYSLYGVFDSCREETVRLHCGGNDSAEAATELAKRQAALETERQKVRREWSERIRSRIGDYLTAQTELHKYPPKGFDQIFSSDDILPAFVRHWEHYLREAGRRDDPVFRAWHAYAAIPADDFDREAARVAQELQAEGKPTNRIVAAAFTSPPQSFAEVIERYAALLTDVDQQWRAEVERAQAAGEEATELTDPAAETLRRVLYGPGAPCEVPDEPIVHIESFMDSAACERLWKLQGEVDRWINQSLPTEAWAVTLVDREHPIEPRIFRRGNPATPGDDVPRQFLSLLSETPPAPFETGSGRRELAEAISDPSNPLTARVIVNRVWAHHFGTGLVSTPSDFGLRADPPSHPELLDWLTTRFIADGWSLKSLHRLILNSAVYRQSSFGPKDPHVLAAAVRQDPANRLLWRMNPHRLSFEEFRDSLLSASGDLDRGLGGRPSHLFQSPYPTRRTLYGLVDRQFFPNVLRAFDFANPDLHIPQRLETTAPQQALFVLNHPFVLERAQHLAASLPSAATDSDRVTQMYQAIYQRPPTPGQMSSAVEFLASVSSLENVAPRPTAKDWQYAYGRYDEQQQRVPLVTPLPHFTGSAWQGGPNWPDAQLGWVQLTATGGHPGNDRDHAAVRRWTAPRGMTVNIASHLVHEPQPGDGIRTFVVSSRQGLLASEQVHQTTRAVSIEKLAVEPGETIDFVVDIGDVLNSDQYLWSATISETSATASPTVWHSETDFPANVIQRLSPWEQLAQVLLGSNEFLFVD